MGKKYNKENRKAVEGIEKLKRRVALVGCGNIANVHAALLSGMENVELCAFADCRKERAINFAERYGKGVARAYESLEELLVSEKPDVIHICTPHFLHVPMAVKALDSGCAVFMEKPPAMTMEQFEQLKEAYGRNNNYLGVCFQNRYNASTRKMDELLGEGRLGEVKGGRAFVTWNREAEYYGYSDWRGKLSTEGGGVLINQSIHTLDLLLHWMGEPEDVEASACNHHLNGVVEVEDTIEIFLRFPGGKRVCFYATTAYVSDSPVLLELECARGRIRLEEEKISVKYCDGEEEIYFLKAGDIPGKSYWGSGHAACITDFYRCLESGTEYMNNLSSVENTMRVMSKAYERAGVYKE